MILWNYEDSQYQMHTSIDFGSYFKFDSSSLDKSLIYF